MFIGFYILSLVYITITQTSYAKENNIAYPDSINNGQDIYRISGQNDLNYRILPFYYSSEKYGNEKIPNFYFPGFWSIDSSFPTFEQFEELIAIHSKKDFDPSIHGTKNPSSLYFPEFHSSHENTKPFDISSFGQSLHNTTHFYFPGFVNDDIQIPSFIIPINNDYENFIDKYVSKVQYLRRNSEHDSFLLNKHKDRKLADTPTLLNFDNVYSKYNNYVLNPGTTHCRGDVDIISYATIMFPLHYRQYNPTFNYSVIRQVYDSGIGCQSMGLNSTSYPCFSTNSTVSASCMRTDFDSCFQKAFNTSLNAVFLPTTFEPLRTKGFPAAPSFNLTVKCTSCFASLSVCLMLECKEACTNSTSLAACETCSTSWCLSSFSSCSGLSLVSNYDYIYTPISSYPLTISSFFNKYNYQINYQSLNDQCTAVLSDSALLYSIFQSASTKSTFFLNFVNIINNVPAVDLSTWVIFPHTAATSTVTGSYAFSSSIKPSNFAYSGSSTHLLNFAYSTSLRTVFDTLTSTMVNLITSTSYFNIDATGTLLTTPVKPLTSTCSQCLIVLIACQAQNCMTVCTDAQLSQPTCLSCINSKCASIFRKCSGVDFNPSSTEKYKYDIKYTDYAYPYDSQTYAIKTQLFQDPSYFLLNYFPDMFFNSTLSSKELLLVNPPTSNTSTNTASTTNTTNSTNSTNTTSQTSSSNLRSLSNSTLCLNKPDLTALYSLLNTVNQFTFHISIVIRCVSNSANIDYTSPDCIYYNSTKCKISDYLTTVTACINTAITSVTYNVPTALQSQTLASTATTPFKLSEDCTKCVYLFGICTNALCPMCDYSSRFSRECITCMNNNCLYNFLSCSGLPNYINPLDTAPNSVTFSSISLQSYSTQFPTFRDPSTLAYCNSTSDMSAINFALNNTGKNNLADIVYTCSLFCESMLYNTPTSSMCLKTPELCRSSEYLSCANTCYSSKVATLPKYNSTAVKDLSSNCRVCMVLYSTCIRSACSSSCGPDATSGRCLYCAETRCSQSFLRCGGFSFPVRTAYYALPSNNDLNLVQIIVPIVVVALFIIGCGLYYKHSKSSSQGSK